ncbi:hypothetical protein [Kutzneria sp. CA-103260]|uniref:hypothetical protein n=1 Tax=Kutzneria sp. CA-103260 TaxID=2802641 RepID=UPI001BAA56A8|nr:hypothetical protein [Kutzneria sp. CA-103260]
MQAPLAHRSGLRVLAPNTATPWSLIGRGRLTACEVLRWQGRRDRAAPLGGRHREGLGLALARRVLSAAQN